ncbi:MAG: hypothetical protein ACKVZJ_03180 [Phycisphaerales bacterium]
MTTRHANARMVGGALRALLLALSVGSAWAQPEPGPQANGETPPRAEGERAQGRDGDIPARPEMLRRVVERQLERSKRTTESLEEIRAMLDRGEPVEAVRRKIREVIGSPGGGFGAGGFGRGFGADLEDRGDGAGERPIERFRRARERGGWPGLFGPGLGGPGGPGAGGGPGGAGGDAATEPPRIEEIIKFVEKERPEMAKRLRDLRERDPEALRVFMRDKGRQIARMMREESEQPELWKARRAVADSERASFQAAREARKAEGDAKGPESDRLRTALRAQFDARAALAQQELAAAKQRVDRLSAQLEEAVKTRDAFLDERLKKALAGEELMQPPVPVPGGSGGPGREGGPRRGEGRPER